MLNQKLRILKYIREHGSISSLEAMQELGILRRASRISDLKQDGYRFRTEREAGKNRYGEKTTYTRYYLIEAEQAA